ncbi:MAG TPA: hypothetical protein VEI53_12010 [Ktedonobacteraceae bacterium]|nr:hypothetical protein [Ktedonobacteraceae bacterium]
MTKLHDMFTQARRAQSGGGIGFVGKNKPVNKPRAAAIVVELSNIDAGDAESAIKSGADGLLFTWDGNDPSVLESLKDVIDAAQTSGDKIVSGLNITGGWENLERENFEHLKELGVNYVLLPLEAPARLLSLQIKDFELAISVPMHSGDMYPIFIRNLTAFDNISAVRLDFSLSEDISALSIEDVLHYRAVREAVRFPALLNVQADLNEAGAYTLLALGVQAMILTSNGNDATSQKQIRALRELLEKVHQEEKDSIVGLTSKQ